MLFQTLTLIITGSTLFVLMFIASIAVIIRKQNIEKKKHMLDHFDSYAGILNYHMERAYDIIHKDQILIYSLEATGLPEEKFDAASRSFGKLVIKILGPMLYKELVYLYGDEYTLIFNMTEYFNTKYESDAIRETALENLSEED
jgi:hypothetical protein